MRTASRSGRLTERTTCRDGTHRKRRRDGDDQAAAQGDGAADAKAVAWFALEPAEIASRLGVDPASGLSGAEAASRLASVGPNKFTVAAVEPRWRAFVRQYRDPMQIVLLVAGIGSLYPLKELGTGLVLLFLTLFNAVLGLRQEGKAAEAVAALQKMMIIKARVRRDGELVADPGRAARTGRHRLDRGRRRRPGRRAPAVGGDARGRRVGADRREPAGLEGRRVGRRRPTRRSATGRTWST